MKTSDPVLQSIVDSLELLKIRIYMVYLGKDLIQRPAIHIHTNSVQRAALVTLVNCIGRYNHAIPSMQIVLRPHNYGDWESYLSLEPDSDCDSSELKHFSDLLQDSVLRG